MTAGILKKYMFRLKVKGADEGILWIPEQPFGRHKA